MNKSVKNLNSLFAILASIMLVLGATYCQRNNFIFIQGINFAILYSLAFKLDRTLSLLSILTFVILGIFTKEPIQMTENIRVVLFSLILIFFSSEKRKIAPAFTLLVSWFCYLTMQLSQIKVLEELLTGIFPIVKASSIKLMLFEIIGLSLVEMISNVKNSKNSSYNLFGYQANILILSIAAVSLIIFNFTIDILIPNVELDIRTNSNLSSSILFILLSTICIVSFISFKFSSTFENIFAHLELCATPDSSFLTLSRKPALSLSEFNTYAKSIRKKSEILTSTRKKATELKVELNAIKRQLEESINKHKDLSIMADSINIGFLVMTTDGTITYVNRIFYEILELDYSDVELLHYTDLILNENEHRAGVLQAIENSIKSGGTTEVNIGDLKVEISEWLHQESSKSTLNLGNKRILVFLRKSEKTSVDFNIPAI